MKNNEESQLFVNQNSKKKNETIKEHSDLKNYLLTKKGLYNLLLIIISIIIFIVLLFIIKIQSFTPSSNEIKENQNNLLPSINQTLINELNEIMKSFEISLPLIVQNKQNISLSKNPKISVVIPIYNNAEKIGLTVHSIQSQNLTDIEIIIIDDNSEDDSVKIIEQFQQEDSRIKLLKNKNNEGILYTRSIGVLNSKGKYIFPINSGDVFINDIFNICYDEAELNFLDIVEFSGYNFSNSTTSPTPIQKFLNHKNDGKIIMQPKLFNFIYREKKDRTGYDIIDEIIFGKCIKSSLYKSAINLLNFFIFTEKLFFYESQVINFGLFKNANSFKFINIKGIIHLHKKKTMQWFPLVN